MQAATHVSYKTFIGACESRGQVQARRGTIKLAYVLVHSFACGNLALR